MTSGDISRRDLEVLREIACGAGATALDAERLQRLRRLGLIRLLGPGRVHIMPECQMVGPYQLTADGYALLEQDRRGGPTT